MVLVYIAEGISRRHSRQRVDVFSTSGELLYRASISFTEGESFSGPANLVMAGSALYVILEGDSGPRLVRNRIKMPATP